VKYVAFGLAITGATVWVLGAAGLTVSACRALRGLWRRMAPRKDRQAAIPPSTGPLADPPAPGSRERR
jgi:hypothetical protein